MDGWFEFAVERYNYWIVIILMMTGLYTVIARGNLVKKVVGLNLFQTSVFIFYITIGKIAGGTAPIYIGDELYHGDGHGGGHGDDHTGKADAAHGPDLDPGHGPDLDEESLHAPPPEAPHDAEQSIESHLEGSAELHAKVENMAPNEGVNDLKAALEAAPPVEAPDPQSLHAMAETAGAEKIANDPLVAPPAPEAPGFNVAEESLHEGAGQALHDVAHAAEIIYTNPLPHVLILTAIVVGVATTAVGLALAVRIREAYGAIEEDELFAIDAVAEFGEAGAEAAGAA